MFKVICPSSCFLGMRGRSLFCGFVVSLVKGGGELGRTALPVDVSSRLGKIWGVLRLLVPLPPASTEVWLTKMDPPDVAAAAALKCSSKGFDDADADDL